MTFYKSQLKNTNDYIDHIKYLEQELIDALLELGYTESSIAECFKISPGAIVSRRIWHEIYELIETNVEPEYNYETDSPEFFKCVNKLHAQRMSECMSFKLEGDEDND